MIPRACVIGFPIGHSRSPMIHRHWLETFGLTGEYNAQEVAPEALARFVASIGSEGLRGCNVTVPHKVAVMEFVDDVSATARAVGAANTLWAENGRIHATNTDVEGFMTHLRVSAPAWCADAGPAVVLGAGGAARATIFGLLEAGVPEIFVVNRTVAKAEVLSSDFGVRVQACSFKQVSDVLERAALLVNTTSLGMTGQPPLEIDLSSLPKEAVVFDIVYAPLETALLAQARARGHVVVDGLGMLLHQAVPGFEKWFGRRPAVTDALRSKIVATLEA